MVIWLNLSEVSQSSIMLRFIGQEWNCWEFFRTTEGMGKAM